MSKSIVRPCPDSNLQPGATSGIRRPLVALLRAVVAASLVAVMTAMGAGVAHAGVVGPDVSSHQHDHGLSLKWASIRWVGGASFAFIKATEGGDYRNPHFGADIAAARQHGLIRGAYHFARPSGKSIGQIKHDATAEAHQFSRAIGSLNGPGNLAPVLDLEDAGTLNPWKLNLWVGTWLRRVSASTGRTPIIYTGVKFWRDRMGNSTAYTAYPLWLAHYGVSKPTLVGGWKSYTFWQYTEAGHMTGTGGLTDLSVFNGSLAQLRAMTVSPASAKAAAAAAAAAAAGEKEARENAEAASTTRRFTTRDFLTSGASGEDSKSSRSSLRPWLGVYELEGSRASNGK